MLTERTIRDVKPSAKTSFIWDDKVKGLGVRITPGGTKSYVLFFRTKGRKRLATLARCAEISLKDARERAGRELAAIREGGSDPLERREAAAAAATVSDLLERFLTVEAPARIALGRLKPATVEIYRYQANKHILPVIGKRRVTDVQRGDIEAVVSRLPGPSRNGVLALLSRLFNLAEKWEWRPQHSNPTFAVDRARTEARDRTLSTDELAALAKALADAEHLSPVNINAIRFAAFTGLRIGEVLAVRWENVDLATGRLLIPESKTGRRWHDLPSPALAVLDRLPRLGAYAFSNTGGRTPAGYSRVRKRFHMVASAAGLENVRLHDLRRTVMTMAAASGVGAHVLRDLLGHKTTRQADAYVRAVGNPVRDAREAVGGKIADAMNGNGV